MTNEEICCSYLQSESRSQQVKVLSELTLYPKEKIIKILLANGINPESPPVKKRNKTTEATGNEIQLPAEIRKEVIKHVVNKGHSICRN